MPEDFRQKGAEKQGFLWYNVMMIKINTKNYLGLLLALSVVLASSFSGFAEKNGQVTVTGISLNEVQEPQNEETVEAESLSLESKFLLRLDEELSLSKTDYHQLLNRINDTQRRIGMLEEEKTSLSQQISNLDDQQVLTQEKLVSVLKEIVSKENTIQVLDSEIKEMELALEYQKEALRDYVRLIYTKEQELFTQDGGEIDAFKMLLSDASVGDNLQQLEYFGLLNAAGQELVIKLMDLNEELTLKKINLAEDRQKLTDLKNELEAEREQLALQKEAKERLLALTDGQEDVYNTLLEESLAQQLEVAEELSRLNEVRERAKREIESGTFNYSQFMSQLDEKQSALFQFQIENYGKSVSRFAWPGSIDKGISAFFRNHGDGYEGTFGVQHNAIDIRMLQGSPVYAAADAVVFAAVDNGYGYSYIILSHAGGFSTIYGHISEILVKPGQFVGQGAIIGLSGGMPGTKGAGYMTTGPHLHFEMKRNDIYVDPLDYLPLEMLKKDQLIEKYYDKWEQAVERQKKLIER